MNEWIIFGIITLIISEILFYKVAYEDEWFAVKCIFLLVGAFTSLFIWILPYYSAFDCHPFYNDQPTTCTNYGIEFFYWYYGVIIVVIVFFLLNRKLVKWKTKQENKKKRR